LRKLDPMTAMEEHGIAADPALIRSFLEQSG
jgi:hypothetical protein